MTAPQRMPHPALVAGTGLWLALVVLAPIAAEGSWSVAPWIYLAFDLVCHQIPERSFFLGDHQLAVCHRCAGLYAGGLIGLLALPWLHRFRGWLLGEPRRMLWCFLPLLIDVALPTDTWGTRFGTGVVAALPVALLLWLAAEQILAPRSERAGPARAGGPENSITRLHVASGKGEP
ncbi:MAG TPA: DUF2085 domain-containing protein [Thermoanaerobaculia bacterium]|nr:DUF2085 domain-containing protein [Thermoanaerobaculia bacterium]